MKFSREAPGAVTVRSVSASEIRIGDTRWSQTVALTSDGVLGEWEQKPVAALRHDDLSRLIELEPELIVLGTGSQHVIPPRELVFAMARSGIGFEVMQTSAAARTFNVLVGEGRQVAAILYI